MKLTDAENINKRDTIKKKQINSELNRSNWIIKHKCQQ